MHLHRIGITGPPPSCARVALGLSELGAEPAPDDSFVVALDAPLAGVLALSRAWPDVGLTVQRFELLGTERVSERVRAGEVEVFRRERLTVVSDDEPFAEWVTPLPDAPRLPFEALREVAEEVLLVQDLRGLDADGPLAVVQRRTQLLERAARVLADGPGDEALEVLVEAASLALAGGAGAPDPTSLVAAYDRAWVVTCAVRHAATIPLVADDREWADWAEVLLHALACEVLDALEEPVETPLTFAMLTEQRGAYGASMLLSTCLRALAIFGLPERAVERS